MPSVAVVGASSDRRKYGNASLRAHANQGWTTYAVHPRETAVEGRPAFQAVADIPEAHLDRVTVYLPKDACLAALAAMPVARVGELWLNPGADDPAVIAKARELGFRVVTACSIVAIGESPATYLE